MRVGVFDSGIGGLTVLRNLYNHYPNNEYIYFGDTENLPYGNKTCEQLNKLSSSDVEFLISKKVDVIIVACGTVSSNCIDYLKNKYQIPIYDIISPVIEYLNNSKYMNVGVIATSATIDSGVFKNNVNKKIYEIKTPKFVPIIENNLMDELENAIYEYLENYKSKLDILVLGCTHYPIIKDYINKYFCGMVELLDMSDLLINKIHDGNKGGLTIYFSKLNDIIIENAKKILELDYLDIKVKE